MGVFSGIAQRQPRLRRSLTSTKHQQSFALHRICVFVLTWAVYTHLQACQVLCHVHTWMLRNEKGLVVTLTTEKVAVCNTNSGAWSRKRKASNVSGVYRSFVDISAEEVDVLKGLTTCGQGSVEEYVSAHPEVVETFVRIANTAREGVRLIRAPLQPGPIARELVPPSVEGLFFKGGPSDNDKRCALRYPHTLQL